MIRPHRSPLGFGKFRDASLGCIRAFARDKSFRIHLPVASAVLSLATLLRVSAMEFCVLVLTIAIVISAELFNTAIETLVKKLHPNRDPEIGFVLDVAAGAVWVCALAAIVVGLTVFVPPLRAVLGI